MWRLTTQSRRGLHIVTTGRAVIQRISVAPGGHAGLHGVYIFDVLYCGRRWVGTSAAPRTGLDGPTEGCDRRDRIDEARTKTGMRRHEETCQNARERDRIGKAKSRNVAIVGESRGESRREDGCH